MLTSRGLGVVLADLSTLGFNAKWGVVSAADIGANHQRERIWIRAKQRNIFSHAEHNGDGWRQQQPQSTQKTIGMANATKLQCNGSNNNTKICMERKTKSEFGNHSRTKNVANAKNTRQQTRIEPSQQSKRQSLEKQFRGSCIGSSEWWAFEPDVGRVANGLAGRVDRLKAIGNGQVPLCAATAWELLK